MSSTPGKFPCAMQPAGLKLLRLTRRRLAPKPTQAARAGNMRSPSRSAFGEPEPLRNPRTRPGRSRGRKRSACGRPRGEPSPGVRITQTDTWSEPKVRAFSNPFAICPLLDADFDGGQETDAVMHGLGVRLDW